MLQPLSSQQFMPWGEAITVTAIRPGTGNLVAKNISAGCYPRGVREAVSSQGGVLQVEWMFTIALCDTPFEPLPYDQVSYRGRTYTIISQTPYYYQQYREINAKDLVIAGRLAQKGNLLRAQDTTDSTGKRVPGYAPLLANVPCRVQPMSGSSSVNAADANAAQTTWRVYLNQYPYSQEFLPLADDVFEIPAVGTIPAKRFSVIGWGGYDDLNQLPWLDVRDEDAGVV